MKFPQYKNWAVDSAGNTVGGTQIEVRTLAGGLASLYEDEDAVTPLSNPFNAGSDGSYTFFVAAGNYQITVGAGMSAETFPTSIIYYDNISFTPEIADAETGGNVGSAGTTAGFYTVLGSRVIGSVRLIDIDTTGLTGGNNLWIRGFPESSTGVAGRMHSNAFISDVTVSGTPLARLSGGATGLRIWDTGASGFVNVSAYTSGSADVEFNFAYEIS